MSRIPIAANAMPQAIRPKRGPQRRSLATDLGITRDQSSQWQKLAKVPKEEFEAALTGPEKPTTGGIIRSALSF